MKRIDKDLERLRESVGARMSNNPHDPALHR
jgi:hypothetical protein